MYTLNGYPIFKHARCADRNGQLPANVILVDRGEQEPCARWVTALHCIGRDEWFWGHYIPSLEEALADYRRRCEWYDAAPCPGCEHCAK